MNTLRKYLYTIIVSCIVLILSGCASRDMEKKDTDQKGTDDLKDITEEVLPVGEFSSLPLELQNTAWLYADQADLYYWEIQWDKVNKILESRIFKWNIEEEKPELLLENTNPDDTIHTVFADQEGYVYLYGSLAEKSIIQYYLKKVAADGSVVWQEMMDYDAMGILEGQDMLGGVADRKGRICLFDRFGKLYIFNEKGQLKKKLDSPSGRVDGMVCAGESGVIGFTFEREPDKIEKSLILTTVDLETGSIGGGITCAFEDGFDVEAVWGGRGNRIYAIAGNFIYEIEPDSGDSRPVLCLDEKYVNIEGSEIQALSMIDEKQPVLYLYDALGRVCEYAVITYCNADNMPEKETITFGTSESYATERLAYYIRRFNRQSEHWRVEIVDYFTDRYEGNSVVDGFTRDVLNGSAPDLIDTAIVPVELLDKVELYENLEPYFASGNKVNQEDILEAVWRAGSRKEGMYFVMPWFSILSYAVKTDKLGGSPWNLQTFMKLADTYPDSKALNYFPDADRGMVLLRYALDAHRELFYDMESGTCHFTEPEFLSLLEGIKRIKDHGTAVPATGTVEYERQFMEDEVLLYWDNLSSMTWFQHLNKSFENKATWVGYPSAQESYHLFYSRVMLSINRYSGNKDGAWEFLEFLLSEDVQKWKEPDFSAFPVRKDGFDYYIKATPLIGPDWSFEEYASEEEIRQLYKMVENTHMVPNVGDQVNSIIVEESMAYFHGDRSVEETAEIIQRRVSLYFQERS